MRKPREHIFSFIDEVSKELNPPYASESETRFLFERDQCYHEITVRENHIEFVSWIDKGSLELDLDTLFKFCSRIRQLPYDISPRLEMNLRRMTKNIFSIFPRQRFGVDDPKMAVEIVKQSQSLLVEMKKIIEEFRLHDKSFDSLITLWNQIPSIKGKAKKGKKLEELLSLLIGRDENFNVVERNVRTKSEEIDIVIENAGRTVFYSQLRSPLILMECKNWTSKIRAKDIRDFAQKVQNRPRVMCSIGVLVATSFLTKDAVSELVGYRGKDFLIVPLNKTDLQEMIEKRLDFGDVLKTKLREAGLR